MAQSSIVLTDAMVAISSSTADADFRFPIATFSSTTAGSYMRTDNVSANVMSVRINRNLEELEDTVMGETSKSRKAGLDDVSVDIEFIQSFKGATSTGDDGNLGQRNIDEKLSDALTISQNGNTFGLAIRPTTADQDDDNPTYRMQAVLFTHSPIDGAVGEILKTTGTFKTSGGTMQRQSSST